MIDPTSSPTPPAPDSPGDSAPESITLTPDQLSALGLDSLADGDTATIQLKASGGDETMGKTFDVVSSVPDSADEKTAPDLSSPLDENTPPDESDPGLPTEPPITDDSVGESDGENDGENGDEESKMLGFTRKKKTPRAGLPDSKKLRDL